MLANNSRSKQNKKNSRTAFCRHKYEQCAKSKHKLLNSMVVGARQSFQIFRQNTWFLEKNTALSNFLYGILHYLISITRLKKNQVIKFNFTSTTRATLNSLHNYFVLGLTWQATLKMSHVKFDLLTDIYICIYSLRRGFMGVYESLNTILIKKLSGNGGLQ